MHETVSRPAKELRKQHFRLLFLLVVPRTLLRAGTPLPRMLSSKVAVAIFVLVTVVGTGTLALILDHQRVERTGDFRRSTLHSLELLAAAVTPAIANGRHDTIQNILENAVSTPERLGELRKLEVVSREGRVLADLDPRRFNMRSDPAALSRDLRLVEPELLVADTNLLQITLPIRITYPLGVIRAKVSEEQVFASLQSYQRQAGALILGTSLVLAVALYLVLRKLVAVRVIDLTRTATLFRQGRMDTLAKASGHDEISVLAESFNKMASSIRAYTEELEMRVTERTAELRRANAQLERLEVTDALTALYNRRHFENSAKRKLQASRRRKKPFSLLMMDFDKFKQLNDRFGHTTGDQVLRIVGEVLQKQVRPSDIAARVGGEEFVVAMPDVTLEEAIQVANAIRESVARQVSLKVPELSEHVVTASFGVCAHPAHGESLSELIAAADTALYQAKRAGRDQVATPGFS